MKMTEKTKLSQWTIHPESSVHMVQYGVWPDCTNNCSFCLRKLRKGYTKKEKLFWLEKIKHNIRHVDWEHQFTHGISLLGGELYYIRDRDLQKSFMELIDLIIERILLPGGKNCKYSTVTNGIYEPSFLYRVIDRIVERAGLEHIDVNFSYDLKYRFKTERARMLAYNNINAFHKRYDYSVGVQMILTQYVIDLWKAGKFDTIRFMDENFPGNSLAFLYPHPIHTGRILPDFYFKRHDFLQFMQRLRISDYPTYINFVNSTKNSSTYKYTGLNDRDVNRALDDDQLPILSDGKEEITSCGHSILYRCYADSDKCVLCDLKNLDGEL